MEAALEQARKVVDQQYNFHDREAEGKMEAIRHIAKNVLSVDVIDQPCIRNLLRHFFFAGSDSWGRSLGHLFDNKFTPRVLAVAISLVSRIHYIWVHIFIVLATRSAWL
jgi:hypothetical protein